MTRRRAVSIQAALVASHLFVLLLPVLVLLGTDALPHDLVSQRQTEVSRQAELAALLLEADLRAKGAADLSAVPPETLAEIRDITHAGVRVIDPNGIVVATTGPRLGEDLSDHPEVASALAGNTGVMSRREVPAAQSHPRADPTKHRNRTWAYAAVPLRNGDRQVGAVLLTHTTRELKDLLDDVSPELRPGAIAAALLTLAGALFVGWRISRSLRALAAIADRMADGRVPEGVLHPLTDTRVAEVRMLARAFEAMTSKLQARLRYNREFASNVSHEFKTPLTTLRGTVDLLVEDAEMPAEQRAVFLANARTDLDRLTRLVGGLLELARAEEGTEHAEVDLDVLTAEVAARHPGVRFCGSAGVARGDEAQLELALENLLANARDHGGPRVTVTAWRDGARAGWEVEDDGPGISAANLARIFDRFFTTGRDREGTGLGLPLAQAVARAHGGDVEVESAPGRTCFKMWVGC